MNPSGDQNSNPESNPEKALGGERRADEGERRSYSGEVMAWLLHRRRPDDVDWSQIWQKREGNEDSNAADLNAGEKLHEQPLKERYSRLKESIGRWMSGGSDKESSENPDEGKPQVGGANKPPEKPPTPEAPEASPPERRRPYKVKRPLPQVDAQGVHRYEFDPDRPKDHDFRKGLLVGGLAVGLWQRRKRKRLERRLTGDLEKQADDIKKLKKVIKTDQLEKEVKSDTPKPAKTEIKQPAAKAEVVKPQTPEVPSAVSVEAVAAAGSMVAAAVEIEPVAAEQPKLRPAPEAAPKSTSEPVQEVIKPDKPPIELKVQSAETKTNQPPNPTPPKELEQNLQTQSVASKPEIIRPSANQQTPKIDRKHTAETEVNVKETIKNTSESIEFANASNAKKRRFAEAGSGAGGAPARSPAFDAGFPAPEDKTQQERAAQASDSDSTPDEVQLFIKIGLILTAAGVVFLLTRLLF